MVAPNNNEVEFSSVYINTGVGVTYFILFVRKAIRCRTVLRNVLMNDES